jgi:hypothetical protein
MVSETSEDDIFVKDITDEEAFGDNKFEEDVVVEDILEEDELAEFAITPWIISSSVVQVRSRSKIVYVPGIPVVYVLDCTSLRG